MVKWSTKLLGFFVVFSSFICQAFASEEDDFGGFPRVSSLNLVGSGCFAFGPLGQSGSFNFEGLLGNLEGNNFGIGYGQDGQAGKYAFPAEADDPNMPSKTNAPPEPQHEEQEEPDTSGQMEEDDMAPAQPSGLSNGREAEIRRLLGINKKKIPLLFKLLHTLNTKGVCEYSILREEVTSKGKKIYQLCDRYREVGLIEDADKKGRGIFKITPEGRYALALLEKDYRIEDFPIEQKRAPLVEEDEDDLGYADEDEIEEVDEALAAAAHISSAGTGVIRTHLNQSYQNKADICRLLEILQTKGECGYNFLRNEGVYSQCSGCVKQGLISKHNNGFYRITPGGLQALKILNKDGFSADPYKSSHKRAKMEKEDEEDFIAGDDENEDEDVTPPKKKPATKKPAKKQLAGKSKVSKPSGDWPEEFTGLKKCESQSSMRLTRSLDDLDDEVAVQQPVQTPGLHQGAKKRVKLSFNGKTFATAMYQPKQPEPADIPPGAESMDEDNAADIPPAAAPIDAQKELAQPYGHTWNDLPLALQGHLVQQMGNQVIPSLLANERLKESIVKVVLKEFGHVLREQFTTQFGIDANAVIEQVLKERLNVTITRK